MKVLFISSDSGDVSVGGVERHISNLINYCIQHSIEAVFLLPSATHDALEHKGSVTLVKRRCLFFNYIFSQGKISMDMSEVPQKIADFTTMLTEIATNHQIGIVDAHNFQMLPEGYTQALHRMCREKNIPAVLTLHLYPKKDEQKLIAHDLFWDKIFCVSRHVASECIADGLDHKKVIVRNLGVNTAEFRPSLNQFWLKGIFHLDKEDKIILCAARITTGKRDILKEKGILNLIDAFAKLTIREKKLKLVIATSSPPKIFANQLQEALAKLKDYCITKQVANNVHIGQFTMQEMPLVYSGATVFVLPSEQETFGQVFIEAMACGIPVISTNVGGIPDIITNDFNGFLVEPNDSISLSQKISLLLNDKNLRGKFVENGLHTINDTFSTDQQFKILFNELNKK